MRCSTSGRTASPRRGETVPDIVDRATRSRMMAAVGSRDTAPELALRRTVHARGLRYRLHDRTLPGSPDLVFRRFGAVCFVHGCFWHRHAGCSYATTPASRAKYWQAKFHANVERDRRHQHDLLKSGWRVAIVWQCALRRQRQLATALELEEWLRGSDKMFETSLRRTDKSGPRHPQGAASRELDSPPRPGKP